MIWKIWILVPVIYGAFSLWYFNWRGPISSSEVDAFMSSFNESKGSKHTDAEVFRRFLEEDDGGEFVMLNLVKLHEGDVEHPKTGEKMPASRVIGEYFGPFALSLLKRGGHPVFQARTIGGNIDSWNADDNVDFGVTAMMRYKSRRDLVELVVEPFFSDAHLYKLAAIHRTISYPTHTMLSTSLRPPVAVFLVLMLIASILQNLAFVFRPLLVELH
ncbi:MAG: hypothetical protein ACI8Z1_002268 [Candidatus Azotimanducaceae bacterium]|jgi:hypothetical protein